MRTSFQIPHFMKMGKNSSSTITHLVVSTLLTMVCLMGGVVTTANAYPEGSIPATVTGKLTILAIDDFKNHHEEFRYLLEDVKNNQRFNLRFADAPPGHLRSGAIVTIRGRAKGRELFLEANGTTDPNIQTMQAAPAAIAGDQTTIVMVANFLDKNVSCSVGAVRDLMFTDPTDQSIDDLYQETSFGGVRFMGDVTGPYTIDALSTDLCNFSAWGQAAEAAARANGVEPDAYNRKIYVMPKNSCPGAGIGTVGGNPSRAWVFRCDVGDIYGHELGHNLGMKHASTPSGEYGDYSDVMGIGQNRLRQVNAPHKEQMGWLPPEQILEVTSNGGYDIAPLERYPIDALAPQALKIPIAGTTESYYLSYRRGIGFDTNLSTLYLDQASIHRWDGMQSNTYLLQILADGETFEDPINGVTVTQVNHNNEYVTVQVNLNTPTCQSAVPVMTVNPASKSAEAGTLLDYAVTVTNMDNSSCASSTFSLTNSLPGGWSGTVVPATLTLLPGESNTATVSVTSATSAVDGDYGLTVNMTDEANPLHTASMSGTYQVLSNTVCNVNAPTLVVSPSNQSGTSGTILTYTGTVTNTDGETCTASTFTLNPFMPTDWNGAVVPSTVTLLPGQNSMVTLSVTSSNGAGAGSYVVGVNVNDPATVLHDASGNATYEVQAATDTTPPTAPTNLSGSAKRKQINLSWAGSTDNVGVSHYIIVRDNVALASLTDTSYIDRDVTAGLTYTYVVVAVDQADNTSTPSNAVTLGVGGGRGGGKSTTGGGPGSKKK